jgi:hypothetical protein
MVGLALTVLSQGISRTALVRLAGAPISGDLAVYGLQRASVMGGISWKDRSEKPYSFWTLNRVRVSVWNLFIWLADFRKDNRQQAAKTGRWKAGIGCRLADTRLAR